MEIMLNSICLIENKWNGVWCFNRSLSYHMPRYSLRCHHITNGTAAQHATNHSTNHQTSQENSQSFDVDLSRCAVSKRIVNRSLLINATSTVRQKPIQFLKTHSYYLDIRRILTRAIIRYPV
eukprot:843283_1